MNTPTEKWLHILHACEREACRVIYDLRGDHRLRIVASPTETLTFHGDSWSEIVEKAFDNLPHILRVRTGKILFAECCDRPRGFVGGVCDSCDGLVMPDPDEKFDENLGNKQFKVDWLNPPLAGVPDFDGAKFLKEVVAAFTSAAKSASAKETISELSDDEKCAIALFAGVPYKIEWSTGKVKFHPFEIFRNDGRWQVLMARES